MGGHVPWMIEKPSLFPCINSKHEIRNPKQTQNSNNQKFKTESLPIRGSPALPAVEAADGLFLSFEF
jgi:hypothetical protein